MNETPAPVAGRHTCFIHKNTFVDKKGVIDVLAAPKGYSIREIEGPKDVGEWVRFVLEVTPPAGTQADLPL